MDQHRTRASIRSEDWRRAGNGGAQGFTLAELIIVVMIMAAVIALLLPAVLRPRHRHYISCVNNLKQVGLAFKCWSLDNGDKFPMQVSTNQGGTRELVKGPFAFAHFAVMSNELSTPKVLRCPQDKQRFLATDFTTGFDNSKVSYFVAIDATETNSASFLSGDRDLTNGLPVVRSTLHLFTNYAAGWAGQLHAPSRYNGKRFTGNLVLTDGSAHEVDNRGLNDKLKASGMRQRLAIP